MEFRDLINESLLIAYQKFEELRSSEAFLSFVIGISVRILANNNKKKKEESLATVERLHAVHDENANTERDMEVYLLHKALALLPEEQRESLILFEITGFSIKEIAEMHNASESAVKQRLKRGREKLIQLLTFESVNQKGEVHYGK